MKTKTLVAVLIAAAMTVTVGIQPVHANVNATGSATIEPILCGLVFNEGSQVDYGTLLNGANAFNNTQLIILNNTGNTPGQVTLAGTEWVEQGNATNTVMLVNQTHFNTSPIPDQTAFDASTQLEAGEQNISPILPNGATQPIYFGLAVELIDSTFFGGVTQTMTFASYC